MMIGLGISPSLGIGKWSPLSLGSNLLAWWDASSGISLSGNQVTAWVDKKGGYSATQAVSSSRPIWASNSFNGAPGMTFDGVDDNLRLAAHAFPTGASPAEVWGVVQQDALVGDASSRSFFSYGSASSFDRQIRVFRAVDTGVNRGLSNVGTGSGAAVFPLQLVTDLSTRHVMRLEVGAATSRLSVDGIAGAGLSAVPTTGSGNATIGASASATASTFWNGKIRDVIVTLPLPVDQAQALQTFLLSRRAL